MINFDSFLLTFLKSLKGGSILKLCLYVSYEGTCMPNFEFPLCSKSET